MCNDEKKLREEIIKVFGEHGWHEEVFNSLMADAELIDWLEKKSGFGLISDDNGHWAVVGDGFQNCPETEAPTDIQTTFFIESAEWTPTIREAILRAKGLVDDTEE